jgi:hypothetical protein
MGAGCQSRSFVRHRPGRRDRGDADGDRRRPRRAAGGLREAFGYPLRPRWRRSTLRGFGGFGTFCDRCGSVVVRGLRSAGAAGSWFVMVVTLLVSDAIISWRAIMNRTLRDRRPGRHEQSEVVPKGDAASIGPRRRSTSNGARCTSILVTERRERTATRDEVRPDPFVQRDHDRPVAPDFGGAGTGAGWVETWRSFYSDSGAWGRGAAGDSLFRLDRVPSRLSPERLPPRGRRSGGQTGYGCASVVDAYGGPLGGPRAGGGAATAAVIRFVQRHPGDVRSNMLRGILRAAGKSPGDGYRRRSRRDRKRGWRGPPAWFRQEFQRRGVANAGGSGEPRRTMAREAISHAVGDAAEQR